MTEQQVGSLAQEALKLARALAAESVDGRMAADVAGGAGRSSTGPAPGDSGTHRPEACDYCPLCQLIALVRSARPEVVEHLEAALVSLSLAARGVVEAWTQSTATAGAAHADEDRPTADAQDGDVPPGAADTHVEDV